MRTLLTASTLTLTCLLASMSHAAEPDTSRLEPLLQAISERLALATPVALSKWDSGKPVQDPAREAQVIANAQSQATHFGLHPEDVQPLLRAQINASKQMQNALLEQWRAAGKAPDTPRQNLATDIRPQLDLLQTRLLQSFALFLPQRDNPGCQAILNTARQSYEKDPVQREALHLATEGLCAARPR